MNLYTVQEKYKKAIYSINDFIDFDTGEFDENAYMSTVESNKSELIELAKNMAHEIKNIESSINVMKDYVSDMKTRIDRKNKKIESMKRSLVLALSCIGEKTICTDELSLSLRSNPGKLIINDTSKISFDYIKVKETTSLDKAKIKKDIESGIDVEGAYIEKTNSVVIS